MVKQCGIEISHTCNIVSMSRAKIAEWAKTPLAVASFCTEELLAPICAATQHNAGDMAATFYQRGEVQSKLIDIHFLILSTDFR